VSLASLLIAAIALSLWHDRFRFVSAICAQGRAGIHLLGSKLAFLVTPNVALVVTVRLDDFAFHDFL